MSSTDGQWEYETLRPPRGATKKEAIDPKAQLNELGSDGWEFVSTVEYVGGGTKYMVFKRPADAGDDGNTADTADTADTDGSGDADSDIDATAGSDAGADSTATGDDGEPDSEKEADAPPDGDGDDQ